MVGAAALAIAGTGAADAQASAPGTSAPTANAIVHPNAATFKGYEGAFVATDGHIRDIDPNGTLENHGPSLVVGFSDSVAMHAIVNGGFIDLFRSDQGDGIMYIGNNNGFSKFQALNNTTPFADPDTTPSVAGDEFADTEQISWPQGHQLFVERFRDFPFPPAEDFIQEGSIQAGTSPTAAPITGLGNGFVTAWVNANNQLTIDEGSGAQAIPTANLQVKQSTSPFAVSDGQGWAVFWQDVNGHLAVASNTPGQTAFLVVETGETLVGSPTAATLSNGAFIHATENPNGHLFVNGVDTGHAVEQGNNPAIATNGSGGWRVLYESLDLFMHTLDSSGNEQVFTGAHVSSDASPAFVGLFSN